MQLSKVIFWDTVYDGIDWNKKARFVICRVLMYGNIADWEAIKDYYGMERIKQEMLQERYLDKKALSFLSCIFDLPKEEFRCYTERQSAPPHWNF
ncbi:MAG: hypothetical protein H6557_31205 [Lewinellaceae bacterium]|nr:hypothetical protein [Phaeodactylibacter sp.]MCB9041120.1 hypothetical protein [Lewinellaceae bacterium]